MPTYALPDLQRNLGKLKANDWVGRSVLRRERPLLFPNRMPEADTGQQRAICGAVVPAHAGTSQLPAPQAIATRDHADHIVLPAESEDERSKPFTCCSSGCTRSFKKEGDLGRHVRSVHTRNKPFVCAAVGCLRGVAQFRFARQDKLLDHVRNRHHKATAAFSCHDPECYDDTPRPLAEFHVHVKHCTGAKSLHGETAMFSAASRFRCPIWTCAKDMKLDRHLAHLQTHTLDEYDTVGLELSDSIHIASFYDSGPTTTLMAYIACPVAACEMRLLSSKAFDDHLLMKHLLKPDATLQAHFSAAKFYDSSYGGAGHLQDPKNNRDVAMPKSGCKVCHTQDLAHYRSFFRPVEDVISELKDCRTQLLRLCPRFRRHPLYDYLRVDATASDSE